MGGCWGRPNDVNRLNSPYLVVVPTGFHKGVHELQNSPVLAAHRGLELAGAGPSLRYQYRYVYRDVWDRKVSIIVRDRESGNI